MRSSTACSRALRGEAKVDYFGEQGRLRGNTLFLARRPESVRIDVFSPFGVMLSTLTANGERFAFLDVKGKDFFQGPANACNVERFLKVPVPPHVLVDLLGGQAPVLVHQDSDATIEWDSDNYLVRIRSRHEATEEIRFEPAPDDWDRPWQNQQLRVRQVVVAQRGVELYRVELEGHEPARTAPPRVDPDGLEPDLPPSGPPCRAELPRRLRFISPLVDQDVLFLYKDVEHNPPLRRGVFRQEPPPGVEVRYAACSG